MQARLREASIAGSASRTHQNTAAMLTDLQRGAQHAERGHASCASATRNAFEKKHGVKLGFMSFFVKAAVEALKEIPGRQRRDRRRRHRLQELLRHRRRGRHRAGLVVPVVRDADAMSFAEIEKTIRRPWQARARRQAGHGRTDRRHLHHQQRRRLRLADVDADHQPAAVGHPRHAQDRGAPGGRRTARS
jgi:hypothetical protein